VEQRRAQVAPDGSRFVPRRDELFGRRRVCDPGLREGEALSAGRGPAVQRSWKDEDDLPAVGLQRLGIETKSGTFVIGSIGIGIGWTSAAGKNRMFDLGLDAGGDEPSVAFAFTMEF
jgi:hypothetical protein